MNYENMTARKRQKKKKEKEAGDVQFDVVQSALFFVKTC